MHLYAIITLQSQNHGRVLFVQRQLYRLTGFYVSRDTYQKGNGGRILTLMGGVCQ